MKTETRKALGLPESRFKDMVVNRNLSLKESLRRFYERKNDDQNDGKKEL